ncbi:MAG: SsrA-binding protein SmpB, partial [bacterium]|nr:SsrA-binding protein SmpB [bacterium]
MAKNSGSKKKATQSEKGGKRAIATNRRARFEYEVLDHLETGIVLNGPEVKSLREGRANLGDAYGVVRKGELFLAKLHISPYEPATRANAEPMRERKLLAHRREIRRLHDRVREKGFTLVPLSLYFDENGRVKVDLALVRGKHTYDKRETIKRREADRDARRSMR